MNEAVEISRRYQPVYLALGSNIRPERFIPLAVEELRRRFPVNRVSSVWQTPAEGFTGADFWNAVVQIETNLTSVSLKYRVLRPLEAQLGRVRTEEKFSPRTIDIDILVFGDEVFDKEIWHTPHLAVPLAELLPDLKSLNGIESISDLANHFVGASKITKITEIQL